MIRKAIVMGIRKINVATEVRLAFLEGFGLEVNSKDIYKAYQSAPGARPEDHFRQNVPL